MRNTARVVKNAMLDGFLKFIVPLSVVALIPACAAGVDPAPGDVSGANEAPVPIATVQFADGNKVEFYGFERNALVSETGSADKAVASFHAPQGQLRADQLVDVWKQLAPEQAVPQALTDLQTRLMNLPEPTERSVSAGIRKGLQAGAEFIPEVPATDDGLLAAPVGCNNGCCDFQWLSTFNQCNQSGHAYNWFFYNYGWSSLNTSDDAIRYNGMVCSAIGTSQYSVNMQGPGGSWSVPQATWRSFSWTASSGIFGWDERAITSSVNSSANSHLHTYCGQVDWD